MTGETRALANERVDRAERYGQILKILEDKGALTAREVAVEMWQRGIIPTPERNFAAPRLTELCARGAVEPLGKRKCAYTRRTVAVYGLRKEG